MHDFLIFFFLCYRNVFQYNFVIISISKNEREKDAFFGTVGHKWASLLKNKEENEKDKVKKERRVLVEIL